MDAAALRAGSHKSPMRLPASNISRSCLRTASLSACLRPRPVNAVLPVNIIVNSLPIKLKAAVVRSVNIGLGLFKEPDMGMQFVKISDPQRDLLRNFITEQIMMDIVPDQMAYIALTKALGE